MVLMDSVCGLWVWSSPQQFLLQASESILKTASETGAVVAGAAAGGTASNPNIRLPLDPGDVAADRLFGLGLGSRPELQPQTVTP